MTEWLIAEPDDNIRTFEERLSVWLMKHPTWAVVFDREVHRLCDLGVEYYLWEELRAHAYWNLYHRHGGEKND